MICSNEPGYYEDGNFGVRIENLVVVKEVETPNRFGGAAYLGFERLTLVPIQVIGGMVSVANDGRMIAKIAALLN